VTVRHDTDVPPSQQLAAILREQIRSGKLPRGSRLPSIVRLADEHDISTSTVQKAMRILRAEGLIKTVRAYGTFVA
jgi:DNA-binding GntR family transcriptional regulator